MTTDSPFVLLSLISFHPETAFFENLGVKLLGYLCGVFIYASAQLLVFLDLPEKILVSGLEADYCNRPENKEFPDRH